MLDPAFVREHVEQVRTGLQNRGVDSHKALEEIATFETIRKRLIHEVENHRRLQRTSGDEVFRARRLGQDTAALQEQSVRISCRERADADQAGGGTLAQGTRVGAPVRARQGAAAAIRGAGRP